VIVKVSKIGFIVVGCLPDYVAVLTLEADDDDLYNYTVLTMVEPPKLYGPHAHIIILKTSDCCT
jgi:hypothetical protein